MTTDKLIDSKIKDFNKNYCNVYAGDSGLGGNDPQEPVDEFACEPSDIRSFIREIVNQSYFSCREEIVKTIKDEMQAKYNRIENMHDKQVFWDAIDDVLRLFKAE